LKFADTRKFKLRALLVLGALLVSYGCFRVYPEAFELWNSQIVDRLILLRPKMPAPSLPSNPSPVFVDGNAYYSRSDHARVIRNLSSMKVAAQVIDFIFNGRVDRNEDAVLADAAAQAGNVYLGMAFKSLPGKLPSTENPFLPEEIDYMEATKWPVAINGNSGSFYWGFSPYINYPELSSASRGLGFINIIRDPDDILRRVPLLVRYGDAFYPSLPFRMVCDFLGVTPERIVVYPGSCILLKGVKINGSPSSRQVTIPIDRKGNLILDLGAVDTRAKHYSYKQVFQASEQPLEMEQLRKELAGKIVILSETVEKPFKIRSSSDKHLFPLATVHAAVIQMILSESFLKSMPKPAMVSIELVLFISLFLLSLRFSSAAFSAGAVLVAGIYAAAGAFIFFSSDLMLQFARSFFILLCTPAFLLVGMGIEKAALISENEKARRIAEHELDIGREIQSGFFPTKLPEVPGWDLGVSFQAARRVAGDFYDVFTLGEDRKVGIVVADVCDKGLGAALFMALLRSFVRVLSGQAVGENHLSGSANPALILQKAVQSINNYISITHEKMGMFSTLFYCVLQPDTGRFHYVNCGHEPPLIIGKGGVKRRLAPTGPVIGLYPDSGHQVHDAVLEYGDTLFVFTDGITDAWDRAGQIFTKQRLEELLVRPFSSAKELIDRVRTGVEDHIEGADQFDDITIVALHRTNHLR